MKYFIALAVIIGLGAFSLYLSVGDEVSSVVDALLSVKPGFLLVMLALMVGYYIIDGRIMQVIARQYNPSYTLKQGFVNNMVGIFFSDLTPSATGGQFAQVYVFRHQGVSGTCASGVLIMALISYQIVIVGYAAVSMLLQAPLIFSGGVGTWLIAVVGFAVNIGVTVVLFFGSTSKRVQKFILELCIGGLAKLHIVKDYDKTSKEIKGVFREFRHNSKELFANKKLFFDTLFLNALKLTMLYSVPFFAFLSVGARLEIWQFPGLLALASAVTMFNTFMPIPGASGGSEGSYMLLYSYLGGYLASSSMLVWRLITFYFGLIMGAVILIASKDVRGYRGQESVKDDIEEIKEYEEIEELKENK